MDLGEKLRGDFPFLARPDAPIYLDNACMTLKPRSVIDAITAYYTQTPFCAGRAVYEGAQAVQQIVEDARAELAAFIGGYPEGTVWTKNATEAINLVAHATPWKKGDVVLTTDREHNSNLVPWQMLRARGVRHEVVASNPDGTLDLHAWRERLARGDVRMVAAVHVSNLDGYALPARELVHEAHERGAQVLLDGAQAAPHLPVDLGRIGADFYAVSLHKMLGPTGVGALVAAPHALSRMGPFITGGDTVARTTYEQPEFLEAPSKYEAGLQNYAGIAGVSAAISYLRKAKPDAVHRHERALMHRVEDALAEVEGLTLLGAARADRSGIVAFSLDRVDPNALAILLEDKYRIMVRSGDHCVHSWFNAKGVEGSVRASFYLYNTSAEADAFAGAVRDLMAQLR